MVHNGIEYGDMQLICEAYFLLKQALGFRTTTVRRLRRVEPGRAGQLPDRDHARHFLRQGPETGRIPGRHDSRHGRAKGTGKWMSQLALDLGVPSTLVTEAVYARSLRPMKEARVRASRVLAGPSGTSTARPKDIHRGRAACALRLEDLQLCPRIRAAATRRPTSSVAAQLWPYRPALARRLHHSRTVFGPIKDAFDAEPKLENLLLADFFRKALEKAQPSWRRVVRTAVELGIPVPGFCRRALAISTAIAAPACRRICCKPSATTSEPHLPAHRQAGHVPHGLDPRTKVAVMFSGAGVAGVNALAVLAMNFYSNHYRSGEEVRPGDHILWAGKPGRVVFVFRSPEIPPGWSASDMDWFLEEHGEGYMLETEIAGRVFENESEGDLEFVSRKQ